MVHLGSSQMPCEDQIKECIAPAKEAYSKLITKICQVHKTIKVKDMKPTTDKYMTAPACEKLVNGVMSSYLKDEDIGKCLSADDQKKMKSFAGPAVKKICAQCIATMPKKHADVDVCKDKSTIMDDMKQCIMNQMMPALMSAKGAADSVKNMCKTDKCKAKLAASCGNLIEPEAKHFDPDYNDGWKPAGYPKDKLSSLPEATNVIHPVVLATLTNMRSIPK